MGKKFFTLFGTQSFTTVSQDSDILPYLKAG